MDATSTEAGGTMVAVKNNPGEDKASQPLEAQANLQLEIFICARESFPVGTAQTNKISLQARALQRAGNSVKVLLLDAFEIPGEVRNALAEGSSNGIAFEYTAGTTMRSANPVIRTFLKVRSFLRAAWIIVGPGDVNRRSRCVFFFVHGVLVLGLLLSLCRLFKVLTVVDLSEWPPALPGASRVTRWFYGTGVLFRLCDGIIPITSFLEDKVIECDPSAVNRVYRMSNLIDQSEFQGIIPPPSRRRYVLWAGMLPEYEETVHFIINAFAIVHRTQPQLDLLLCGKTPASSMERIFALASSLGIQQERISFPGFVSRQTLLSLYAGAEALLIPLDDDERSRARFPFKIGEYLSAKRPVVTSAVGDIPNYLTDGKTAMICKGGDVNNFAEAILYLAENPQAGNEIGEAGYDVAHRAFNYQEAGKPLTSFIKSLQVQSGL